MGHVFSVLLRAVVAVCLLSFCTFAVAVYSHFPHCMRFCCSLFVAAHKMHKKGTSRKGFEKLSADKDLKQ